MLGEHGHEVADRADGSGQVWVLDDPDLSRLGPLLDEARAGDEPSAVVVLSDDPSVARVLADAGLRGWACLGRDAEAADLDLAVRAANGSLVLLDRPTAARALTPPAAEKAPDSSHLLTPRETQVLQLMAQGLPNKAIGRTLGISENTAKYHVGSVTGKLGAGSRTEAVTAAARRGLIVL